jgi:apolipoprotein N-acyltransferase
MYVIQGASLWQRAFVGWIIGVFWFGISTLWMLGLTGAGWPASVLLGWGTLVAITTMICPPDQRALFALPAALVAFEWFHDHAPLGGIPLSMVALGQTNSPLAPVARIGGFLLVGAATAALGAVLYLLVQKRWKVAGATFAGIVVVAVAGAVWPLGDPVGEVTIAAVQGGGEQGLVYEPGSEIEVFNNHIEATRTIPDDADVDVVVWPENTVNISYAGSFDEHPWRDEIAAEAARIGAPIVVGVVEDSGTDAFVNYAVAITPEGDTVERFDKIRRVPFGEYVPLRPIFEPVAGDLIPERDQIPGEGVPVMEVRDVPMAVVISWEVFFSRRVREGVREGGEVVVNPTNGASYWLTQVQTQQIATSQLRAFESGRWVLQVAPTGFSAFVSPDGEVQQRTAVSETQVITQTIARYDSTVPAQALGATPALLAAAIAFAFAWVPSIRRRGAGPDGDADLDPDMEPKIDTEPETGQPVE